MTSTCHIVRYRCPEDTDTIKYLAKEANIQQSRNSGFEVIFPWRDLCENEYHYVARDSTGIICGWLTARIKKFKRQTYMYLSEISTRRIRNSLYGGIGQRLHNAFIEDAERSRINFISLYPLDKEIEEMYLQPKWGYEKLRPGMKYIFRILKGQPSEELLDSLMPTNGLELIKQAEAIASETKDSFLADLIQNAKPMLIQNLAKINELEDELMIMEGNELNIREQANELRIFFLDFLKSLKDKK